MPTTLEAPECRTASGRTFETASSSPFSVSASPPASSISPVGLSTSPARRSGKGTRAAERTPDLPLLRGVLDLIDRHPELWDQRWYVCPDPLCGTTACVAGHALLMRGFTFSAHRFFRPDGTHVSSGLIGDEAASLLGLTRKEQEALFRPNASRADVQRVAERIAARAGGQL
jgi:hypothetical protein